MWDSKNGAKMSIKICVATRSLPDVYVYRRINHKKVQMALETCNNTAHHSPVRAGGTDWSSRHLIYEQFAFWFSRLLKPIVLLNLTSRWQVKRKRPMNEQRVKTNGVGSTQSISLSLSSSDEHEKVKQCRAATLWARWCIVFFIKACVLCVYAMCLLLTSVNNMRSKRHCCLAVTKWTTATDVCM